MREFWYKLIVVFFALFGQSFTLGVLIWQTFTNMYGFWFWFSLISVMSFGFLIALINDSGFVKECSASISNASEEKKE